LQTSFRCRFAGWLAAGVLLIGLVGCQRTEMPAARDTVFDKQPSSALAGSVVHEHGANADFAAKQSEQQAAAGSNVLIDNFTFKPETLEVAAGTKVIWVNHDDVPHTVRSIDDTFRSGTLDTDDVYERVFSEPGTYEYYCGVHRHMTGKIVVE